MRIEGTSMPSFAMYTAPVQNRSTSSASGAQAEAQVQKAQDAVMRTLEFAFYKQQDMNMKLVRVAGELYQGKNLDSMA